MTAHYFKWLKGFDAFCAEMDKKEALMEAEEIRSAMRNILLNRGLMPWPFNEEAVRECFRTWEAWQVVSSHLRGHESGKEVVARMNGQLGLSVALKLTEREALDRLLRLLIANNPFPADLQEDLIKILEALGKN